MTANIPAVLFNFLALAFFVVIAIGIALGAYAARSLKRMEPATSAAETPVKVAAVEAKPSDETASDTAID